jgi:Zn-dependent peptidase ImmA (M78 family)
MNRLRAYRDIEGINQQELGEILGLSTPMVSAVEAGRREFAGTLEPLGYADDRLTLPPMSEPLHRQRASTSAAAKKRAKELLRLAGEVFGELRKRTPKAPTLGLERHPASTLSFEELEEFAIEVRCALDHEESGPIQNLTAAVERAGVCLIPIVGLHGVDGISAWVDGVPVIGLAPNVPGDRLRFSLSHELAHLLFHLKRSELTESEANRFAGALLFPQAEFDAAMPEKPQLRDFIALKSSWGVAVSALVYRAHELDYVDDARYRALQIQMSKWRKAEPGRFEPVYGTLFGRLVEVNGGTAKVSDDLGINRRHLAELSNWTHLRVA